MPDSSKKPSDIVDAVQYSWRYNNNNKILKICIFCKKIRKCIMLKVCLKILFSVMTIILFNAHAYAEEDFQSCSLIERFEQTPSSMKLIQLLEKRSFKPFLLIANNTYDCACLLDSRIGGDSDAARIGGDSDTARIGGDSDAARIGGDSDAARIGGDS
ncbi:hypothetical protein QL898_13525, partial [Psychrobacter sp. APC 3279]|uniref:hypothetical protein n=1 Tax=Psychrobacter sp. APC 3279 TaxID=3035189 RepID=UPI0025B38E29